MRHPVSVGKHTVPVDFANVKRREFEHGIVSLIGAGPGGESFARVVDRRGAHQLKEVHIIPNDFAFQVRCTSVTYDGEDALRQVISKAAGKAGYPFEPTLCGT